MLYFDVSSISSCFDCIATSSRKKIPAHYGFDNQVDRWGSKYEAFVISGSKYFNGILRQAKEETTIPLRK